MFMANNILSGFTILCDIKQYVLNDDEYDNEYVSIVWMHLCSTKKIFCGYSYDEFYTCRHCQDGIQKFIFLYE